MVDGMGGERILMGPACYTLPGAFAWVHASDSSFFDYFYYYDVWFLLLRLNILKWKEEPRGEVFD